jgi:hypothetical protein
MKNLIMGFVSLFILTALTLPVLATSPATIEIPVSTIIRSNTVGSTHLLATRTVDQNMVGYICEVSANALNQGSVHPDNDLVITSNGTKVVLDDVERVAAGTTTANGTLTLGNDISVSLVIGKDKVFSAGMTVAFNCEEPEPEPIQVCRNGEVITIDEDQRLNTDTNLPCPEQTKIEVCRDGKVISILEDDKRTGDTNLPCPQVQGETKVLPNTGVAGIASGFFGVSGLGVALNSWIDSRKGIRSKLLHR